MMRKTTLVLIIAGSIMVSALQAQKTENKEEWVALFNGKDLTGWDIKIAGRELNDNYNETFRVEDGMIRVRYDKYNEFNDFMATCITINLFHIINCGSTTGLPANS